MGKAKHTRTKYDNEWVLVEYIESLERMLDATLHQLKQSKKNLVTVKNLINKPGRERV